MPKIHKVDDAPPSKFSRPFVEFIMTRCGLDLKLGAHFLDAVDHDRIVAVCCLCLYKHERKQLKTDTPRPLALWLLSKGHDRKIPDVIADVVDSIAEREKRKPRWATYLEIRRRDDSVSVADAIDQSESEKAAVG